MNYKKAITDQSKRKSISNRVTEASIRLYTNSKVFFSPLLYIEFHQNVVTSNMHYVIFGAKCQQVRIVWHIKDMPKKDIFL